MKSFHFSQVFEEERERGLFVKVGFHETQDNDDDDEYDDGGTMGG